MPAYFYVPGTSGTGNPLPWIIFGVVSMVVAIIIAAYKYGIAKKNGEALGLSKGAARWQAIVNTDVMAASSTSSVAANREVDLISNNDELSLDEKLQQLDEALATRSITKAQHARARTRLLGQV